MTGRTVSMKDVANAANVHQTTVSLAFRNSPKIPQKTKDRILEAARKLGYRKNPLVSALMANRLQASRSPHDVKVAYVTAIPNGSSWMKYDPHLPDYYGPAAKRFEELGFQLERMDFSSGKMSLKRFFKVLNSRSIHGLLIAPMPETVHLDDDDLAQVSVVSLGKRSVFDGIHHVSRQHGQIVRLAIEKCLEYGYRRIGFCLITNRQWEGAWDDLLGSYLSRQHAADPSERIRKIPPFLSSKLDANVFGEWIQRHKVEVVITNKVMMVQSALMKCGIDLPQQVGIVSLDDQECGKEFAGIESENIAIAEAAATMLAGMLTRSEFGVPKSQTELLIMGQWKDGDSLLKNNTHARG